jgi:large subunit ribosomal protein L18
MSQSSKKVERGVRRARRVRRRVKQGSRLRLSVFRSARYIYAQVIDDDRHRTLAAADSVAAVRSGQLANGGNVEAARLVGKTIAEKAKSAGIESVVFDRGPYKFHGRVKALADSAREAGLRF